MEAFKQNPDRLENFLELIEDDLANVRRVISYCRENDIDGKFIVHGKSETAEESARKTDKELDQIVKTLVFRNGEEYVAVLCPGDSRVSEEKLEEQIGGEVEMASPEEVKEETGYVIGSVSPFDLKIEVFMEEALLEKEVIRPAAGSRVVGIEVDPEELKSKIEAITIDLTE